MGLGSLKEQKEHFKRVFVNKTGKIFTDEVKQRLEHGKKHEIDAMASFVGKVMPVYLPNSNYKETGSCVVLKDEVAKGAFKNINMQFSRVSDPLPPPIHTHSYDLAYPLPPFHMRMKNTY